jgi:hypothetical protein
MKKIEAGNLEKYVVGAMVTFCLFFWPIKAI